MTDENKHGFSIHGFSIGDAIAAEPQSAAQQQSQSQSQSQSHILNASQGLLAGKDYKTLYEALDQVRSTQASRIMELEAQISALRTSNNMLHADIECAGANKKAMLHPLVSYFVGTELFEDRVGYLIEKHIEGYMQGDAIVDAIKEVFERHFNLEDIVQEAVENCNIDDKVEDAVRSLTFEVSVR